jgi:hypothetical protein
MDKPLDTTHQTAYGNEKVITETVQVFAVTLLVDLLSRVEWRLATAHLNKEKQ